MKFAISPRYACTCNAYFPLEPVNTNPMVIPTDVNKTPSYLINTPPNFYSCFITKEFKGHSIGIILSKSLPSPEPATMLRIGVPNSL